MGKFLVATYVPRSAFLEFPGTSTCAFRGPHLFSRQVNICSRHCNEASGYDVNCIWNCGGWSDYFLVVPSLSPHRVPCVDTYLLLHWFRLFEENFLGNTQVWHLLCSSIPALKNQTVLELPANWVAAHYCSRSQKMFIFILPRSCIYIVVIKFHFGIGFIFLWLHLYVSWWLAGCELTHFHPLKHLRLVGANFADKIIVIRQHFFNNVRANPTKFCIWNFTALMIRFRL